MSIWSVNPQGNNTIVVVKDMDPYRKDCGYRER